MARVMEPRTWTDPVTGKRYDVIDVPLAKIGMPEPYIRQDVSGQRVNLLVAKVKGGENEKEQLPKDQWRQKWPVPPVMLMRLEKPVVIKATEKVAERTIDYRLLDGVHRTLAFTALRTAYHLGEKEVPKYDPFGTIPAVIEEPMTKRAAWTVQFRANNNGPLPFDREGRDYYIREGRKLGTPLIELATETGLTEASVSRIVKGSQGKSKAEVSKSRKKAASKRGKRGAKKGAKKSVVKDAFEPAHYFNGLSDFARVARSQKKSLVEFLKGKDSAWNKAQELIDALRALRG